MGSQNASKNKIVQVRRDVGACRRCELVDHCTGPIPVTAAPDARWLVLTDAPTAADDKARSLLNGAGSEAFAALCADAGLGLADAAVTAVISCHPNGVNGTRKPKAGEVAACAANLAAQVDAVDPAGVLLLGNQALHAYRPDLRISRAHGHPFTVPGVGDRVHMAIYHPRALSRSRAWVDATRDDLERFAKILADPSGWRHHTKRVCVTCAEPVGATDRSDPWGLPVCDSCPTMDPDTPTRAEDAPLRGAVEVLVDDSGRVGALAYKVPRSMTVRRGDAVHVPFGNREAHGVVVGVARDAAKATKGLLEVLGPRARSVELDVAVELAGANFCDVAKMAPRLAPRRGRGHARLEAGVPSLRDSRECDILRVPGDDGPKRRYLLAAPGVDMNAVAAHEALRLSGNGQVLVLAPTAVAVTKIVERFGGGAVRLDSKAPPGAWRGFREGTVPIGVGTRAAALYSAHNLAGIVVADEEHPGHVEASMPYTHARDIAARRVAAHHCALVVIGRRAEPAALAGGVRVVAIGRRADWPTCRIVDRDDFPPHQQQLPPTVRAAASRAARDGREVVVVARERARRCSICGEQRPCAKCGSITCNHADRSTCRRCGSDRTRGTLFDEATTQRALGAGVKVVDPGELLTLRVPGALIILAELDLALTAWDLVPGTSGARLIHSAMTATGPGGAVWGLTRTPKDSLIVNLLERRDQVPVARRAYRDAKAAALPPFGRLVKVTTRREREPQCSRWPGVVHGPMRNDAGEWEILVRISDSELPTLRTHIDTLRRGGKVRIHVS